MFNWTLTSSGGKPMMLENCHNGPLSGSPASQSPFGPHVPTRDWCREYVLLPLLDTLSGRAIRAP
jgi:hypothetical protein